MPAHQHNTNSSIITNANTLRVLWGRSMSAGPRVGRPRSVDVPNPFRKWLYKGNGSLIVILFNSLHRARFDAVRVLIPNRVRDGEHPIGYNLDFSTKLQM